MKKLKDMNLLKGEQESISITEFRAAPGEVFEQIALGKTYTITSYKKPIATLKRYEPIVLLGAEVRRLGLQGK